MKSKKNILLIVLAVLIIARLVIMFFENKNNEAELHSSNISGTVKVVAESPQAAPSVEGPAESVTTHTSQADLCQLMRAEYQNLNDVIKRKKASVRFVNIHKQVDGVVYRTRFFYKESSESDIPTYLLYKEDQNEEPILIETSPYKKGKKYTEIEKAAGTIIYSEEGVNIGAAQDLFVHYENKELKDLQGINPELSTKDFIECRF